MPDADPPITELRLSLSGAESVLPRGEHVVGRSLECGVRIDDPLISRRHAIIVVSPESVAVRDLGSRNGVLVNGDEIDRERALVEGDLVTIGSQVFTVRQIRRVGDPRVVSPGSATAQARSAPLARIALQKRGPTDERTPTIEHVPGSLPASPTTLGGDRGISRAYAAYRLIAEAAARAIATDRAERAEKVLEAPLNEVRTAIKRGASLEAEVIDFAVEQALALCASLKGARRHRWIDYVHELHEARRVPIPLEVADRLARAMPTRADAEPDTD
jgi:pSer/pThr/pTyr-binding forkhead associated (FHA) protein